MSACQEDADDSTINDMHYLQAFQSTLDRIWISCIVYPNDDEEGEITPNSRFCDLMTEAVDEFYSGHVHHPAREVLSGLHNALRIIATSSHSFPASDEQLTNLCLKIYGHCVEILFDKSWMNVQDGTRASATKEFYNFYCCLSNWSQDRFLVLAVLSQKPWGHEIMNMVLGGEENTDKAEVERYLTLEGKYLLEHRLRVLIQEGLYHHALNLAKACTDHPDLGQEPIFLETLYLLYFNLGMTDELRTQVDDHPAIQHVMKIANSMSSYCPEHASNLSKLIIERVWSDKRSSNLLVKEAVEQWLDTTLKVCSPDSDTFAEGLEDISTLTKNPFHLYNFADLVHKKVGVSATPPMVSICLKALTVPSLSPIDDIIHAVEIDYGNAAVCTLLAELLEDDMRMQWLCLLAAFFIAPSLTSLSALKDSYQDTKESQRPKLTSYQQHDLIKCMEFFIPVFISLSDDWKNLLAIFEGYFRKSKVICITLMLPGDNVKRLKLYDKSWHPGRADFKPMGVIRVKEAFFSLQRCHKGINLLSCKQERQIPPKMKRKRSVEQKNSQECPKLSETTVGVDDETSPEWLPCLVLDLQQEVLTKQEFIDQSSSDTPLEAIRNAPSSQAPQSLLEMPEVSMQSRISGLENLGLVEEERPDLQQAQSQEILDNYDMANSSSDLKANTSKRERVPQVHLHGEERERDSPIITQEIQLNEVPMGAKDVKMCVNRSNSKSDVTVAPAMLASYPEPEHSGDPTLTDTSSDTGILFWTDEQDSSSDQQDSSSDQSEYEDELSNDDKEQDNLEQEETLMLPGIKEKLQIDVSKCQRNCSEYDDGAKHSHECENPVSLKLNVSNVAPCCTQDEVINLEEEMSADRKTLVQSVLTDVVEAVLVTDEQANELSFNSITQDSQSFIKGEQMHVHNSSPVQKSVKYTTRGNRDEPPFQQDKNNEVESCTMSLVEGLSLQRGTSHIKTSVCSVKLKCFMKQRAKKPNPKNLKLWRFLIRERDKERGEDAKICTDGVDFDVKSPEQDLAHLSVDKVSHLGKAAAEILHDEEDMPILQERAGGETKVNQMASVCSEFQIPWIEEQIVEGEQPEIDGQFSITCGSGTYHQTNVITSAANCVSSYVRGNSPVHDNQSLLQNQEVSTEGLCNLGDPIWAGIASFNQGRYLESVTWDKMTNFLEHRTVESPMLGNESHTCPMGEIRDMELPVLTQETEVDKHPVTIEERETNQTTFRNDVAILSRMKDSFQKSENLDIPILLDCCDNEFHVDETHDKDLHVSSEPEGNKGLVCPQDALELSRIPSEESVDHRTVDHIEQPTVLEKESGNKIQPLVSSLMEHIHVQQGNVHAKKSVCCTNLPCSMDRTTGKKGQHSLAEEWRCILSNKESKEVAKNCTCAVDLDLIPQEIQFDQLSLYEVYDKGAPEGNMDKQNNRVEVHNLCEYVAGESSGNNITDFCNEFTIPWVNGEVTPEEQPIVDGQVLMTRESTTSLNHGTDMMHSAADYSNVARDSTVKAVQPCLQIPEISIEGPCNKLGDTIGAGMTNLHEDKSLENGIMNCANSSKYRTVESHMQEKEVQMYPVYEANGVKLLGLTPETEVNKHHVTVEEGETSQGMLRNDLQMQDSSYRIEKSDIPGLLDCAAKEFHEDETAGKEVSREYAGNEDLICVKDVDKCSRKPIGVNINQNTMCAKEKPTVLANGNSNELEQLVASQMKHIDFQQRTTHLKKSVSSVSLPCNMDRSTTKENPHTPANDWRWILENSEGKGDSKSCTSEVVDIELKPADKHLDHPSLDPVSDLGTTEGNMVSQSKRPDLHKLCQNDTSEAKQNSFADVCTELRISWVDGQVTPEKHPEVDGPVLMITENGRSPNNGVSMPCLGDTCVPSTIGNASAQPTHRLHLEAPELSMQCINTKTNSPILAIMPDLKHDMSLENISNDPTAKTQGQEHKLQRYLASDNQGRQVEECKVIEKNNEKTKRRCQGEEREVPVSSKLLNPLIDAEAAVEVQPSEDGQYLMLQEGGIRSNDGFGHHRTPEVPVRQVTAIETSTNQEAADIDSWGGNCGESSGVKEEEDLLCRESRENKEAGSVMEKPSDQKSFVQESDHRFPSASENLGMAVKSKGATLVQAGSKAIVKSSKEKRCSGKTEGGVDIKRTSKTFLSDNCKNEPFNTSSLFGKRDAMYGVTYSRTAFKQPSVLKSFTDQPINQSASIKRFSSKKSGNESSSDKDSRMCPARTTNKFISKKSLKASPSQLPSHTDQIVTQQPSMKRCASRKSHKESPSQQESRRCPVQTTNKFMSKKFWTASLSQLPCERVTRKTVANPKTSVQRTSKKTSLKNQLGSDACERCDFSHLPLQSKPATSEKRSFSSRVSVKSFSCKSQTRSCAEAPPPPKLLKLSSTCTSPAQPSPKPLQKHLESSRKSVRQEVQRSSIGVHGVMTRRQINVESQKKGK